MRRHLFAALIGSVALAWPGVALSQAREVPTIGFLSAASEQSFAHFVDAFRAGLKGAGFVEGENVALIFRWADGDPEKLPELAADLVRQGVSAIVASGGDRPALAAKAATSTIPIVFTGSDDPVRFGLVDSLAHPGGNVTGATLFTSELEIKKLELLHELVPTARQIGFLVNPGNPTAETDAQVIQGAAEAMGLQLLLVRAHSEDEISAAFAALKSQPPDGLLIGHDPYFNNQRQLIVELATQLAVPAIYEHREFVLIGGLISYGNVIQDNYRLAGGYVGRILKGAKPADLPVQQATKFELVINQQTARSLGIDFPPAILVRADDVIE